MKSWVKPQAMKTSTPNSTIIRRLSFGPKGDCAELVIDQPGHAERGKRRFRGG